MLALALFGCGDDDVASDAAPDVRVPIAIEAPIPPAPPDFGECLPGYHGGGQAPCRAYDEGPTTCPSGEAHFPGEPGCVRIGSECPKDGWPAGVDETAIHVRLNATGGDGTRTRPYGSVDEALEAASPGATIALHTGLYGGASIRKPVEIVGACSLRTGIGRVIVAADDVVLRDLFVNSTTNQGILLNEGASARVEEVAILDSIGGIAIDRAASVVARTLVVRRTLGGNALDGDCIELVEGASIDVERAVLEGCVRSAVLGSTDTRTTLSRVHVQGGEVGRGVQVEDGVLEARGLSIAGVNGVAILAQGTSMTLDQIEISDVHRELVDGDEVARGIAVQDGADVILLRSSIRGTPEIGVAVDRSGSSARIGDAAFDVGGLRGIAVQRGGTVAIERATIRGSTEFALMATDAGRALMRDVIAYGAGGDGAGIRSQLRSVVVLERVELTGFGSSGAAALVSSLSATDLSVHDMMANEAGYAHGVVAQHSRITLMRTAIDETFEAGVMVRGNTASLEATDLDVRTARALVCPDPSCRGGIGVVAVEGARASVDRFAITAPALCGALLAFDASLELHRGIIDTAPFGVCVQVPGYDLTRLSDDVQFVGVDAPLATTDLPVPDPYAELEGSPP